MRSLENSGAATVFSQVPIASVRVDPSAAVAAPCPIVRKFIVTTTGIAFRSMSITTPTHPMGIGWKAIVSSFHRRYIKIV
jgi:hypothetical protein